MKQEELDKIHLAISEMMDETRKINKSGTWLGVGRSFMLGCIYTLLIIFILHK